MSVKEKFQKTIESNFVAFFYFLLIAFIVFWPTFTNLNFFWDDERFIFLNPEILQAKNFFAFWNYKSVFFKSWPLGYGIFWSLIHYSPLNDLFFYKSLNIVFHALNTYLIFRLLKIFNFPFSFFLALVFLVHPLQVETVSWIFQFLTILSFTFFMLSLLSLTKFIEDKKWLYLVLSFLLFLFSLWTKSIALLAPVLYLSLFYLTKSPKKTYFFFAPFLLTSLIIGLLTIRGTDLATKEYSLTKNSFVKDAYILIEKVSDNIYTLPPTKLKQDEDKSYYDFIFPKKTSIARNDKEAVLKQAPWHYFSKLILPINLQFIYPKVSYPFLLHLFALSFLFVIPVIFIFKMKERTWILIPVLSFVFLLPYLGLTDIAFFYWSNVSDRYTYYFILTLLFSLGIFFKNHKSSTVKIVLTFYVLFLSVLSLNYGLKFNNPKRLYEEIIHYKPDPVIYSLLFEKYLIEANGTQAKRVLDEATSKFPNDPRLEIDKIRLKSLLENQAQ